MFKVSKRSILIATGAVAALMFVAYVFSSSGEDGKFTADGSQHGASPITATNGSTNNPSTASSPSFSPEDSIGLTPWGDDAQSFAVVTVGQMISAANAELKFGDANFTIRVTLVQNGETSPKCTSRSDATVSGDKANDYPLWCASAHQLYVPVQALKDRATVKSLNASMFLMLGVGEYILTFKGWKIKPGFTACAAGYTAKTLKAKGLVNDTHISVMKMALPINSTVDLQSWFGKGYYSGLDACMGN